MNIKLESKGAWFVYDGDCPICRYAAEAFQIKEEYGEIFTVNAREQADHPIVLKINDLGLDLDEGMIIYADNTFYHGDKALKFLAKYGTSENIFINFTKGIFLSDHISHLTYPWMRAVRNALLRQKGFSNIDNLKRKDEPIFKSIFGDSWNDLPVVFKNHYRNRPYSQEKTIVVGGLDVYCKPPLLWFKPILKMLGQIPTRNEPNIPVTVTFESDKDTRSFHFKRVFNYSKGKPYQFKSRMLQISGNEVVEIMRFGFAWKMQYSWNGQKIVLTHSGYALAALGHLIPLPLSFFLGKGYAEERPIDETTFEMETNITHPWWGKIYEYKGRFEVTD